ncbi:MAG TPA: hypothetical protein VFV75_11470 [Candidatus Polarisedimenticolaceae bacterium]|nr:hypothetical protein [Candidatus Polarisedimenticolaceae bacterium]
MIQAGEQCDDGSSNNTPSSCCTTSCTYNGKSPDVIVGELPNTSRYGPVNGITAYAIGTTSCNLGSCWLLWISGTPDHPVIGQNMYRLKDNRFEQIGQSWLKHGFTALQGTVCSSSCQPSGTGARLGIQCSDPYDSSLNGSQTRLGPRRNVNPNTGVFLFPDPDENTTGDAIFKRLQVHNTDLEPTLNPGALYFVEGQYVARDDADAKNQNNNASYRRVTVGASPYSLTLQGSTQRGFPAIRAWKANDPSVVETDILTDGLMIMGAKVTPLGGGQYHYEYAVHNLNSHRGAKSFSVPLPPGATVTNVGFHDVDYHSGEPFDGTDWAWFVTPSAITWSTQAYEVNQNANALRWGTLYNFRFDANMAPGSSLITVGMFKPGSPASYTATTLTPVTCASAPNGTACSDGNACTTSDSCQAGACVGSSPVVCDPPADACHDPGACNPATGACVYPAKPDGTACDDGSACTATDVCLSGACSGQSPVVCTPIDSCHDAGACNPATGACSTPAKPDGSACDDGNGCTTGDACQGGSCQPGSPVVCAPIDSCHDAGVCDAGTGACSNPAKPDGTACDDGSGCTANDACAAGTCTGDGVPVPAEVSSGVELSRVDGVTTISWTPAAGSTSTSVLRGLLSALPVGPGAGDEVCLDGGTGTSITDDSDPWESEGYWYLVSGVNSCGHGSYGWQWEDGAQTVERESTTCP